MNKILLPLFVAHISISEALLGRKRTRYSFPTPSYTPIVRDSIRNVHAVGASSSAIVVDTMNMQAEIISNMGCSNSSSSYRGPANANVDGSPRKQARISTAEYNADRVANDTLGGVPEMTGSIIDRCTVSFPSQRIILQLLIIVQIMKYAIQRHTVRK